MEIQSFQPQTYLKVIASQLGTRLEDIPSDVLSQIEKKRSQNGVNEIFFPWLASFKEQAKVKAGDFSAEDEVLFQDLGAVKNLDEYKRTEAALKNWLDQMEWCLREHAKYGKQAIDARTRLAVLEGKEPTQLKDLVNKIQADGWYRYSSEETKSYNQNRGTKYLVFITPRVVMKYYDKTKKAEVDLDMGQYKVLWQPNSYSMQVLGHKDNITAHGHIHSHINSGGSICWGNAGDRVSQAIAKGDPVPQFRALQTLLQTYNAESPYVGIEHFIAARDPKLLDKMGQSAGEMDSIEDQEGTDDSYGWISIEDADPTWLACDERCDERFDDDNEEVVCERLYRLFAPYTDDGQRMSNNYWVANQRDEYILLAPNVINDFEGAGYL